MRINRFYFPEKINKAGVVDDPSICNQIKKVLRLTTGEEFVLFNDEGVESVVKINFFGPKTISFDLLAQKKFSPPVRRVNLFLAILKKENFDWAVLKSVEVGVANIFPFISDRTIKLGLNYGRLNTIIKEAVEQSGQRFLPKISPVLKFEQAIKLAKGKVNFFADIGSCSSVPLVDKLDLAGDDINIWIGPEGGWSSRELKLAEDEGFDFVSLGDNILRAETAVVVAGWLAVNKK